MPEPPSVPATAEAVLVAAAPRSPAHVLASIGERRLKLELTTLELGFLALLHLRSTDGSLASFSEAQLMDAFEQACNAIEPTAENVRSRATHTLRRLREQQLLTRVDGSGVVRPGEYALSRLALGIVDYYVEDEVLTRESLSLLTRTLSATLAQVLSQAQTLVNSPPETQLPEELWRHEVTGQLTVTCRELLVAIEKRQRGLDQRQEQFQRQISSLLSADWFGSLEHCQSLLDTSAEALRELNDVLLRDTHHLQALLTELSQLAEEDHQHEAARAAATVLEQVDRIAGWGAARQKAWTDYYEYVHRFLRDVVRLDPARALSQRLKAQLVDHAQRAFALTVASPIGLRTLREPTPIEPPPPVRRPRKPRETDPQGQSPQPDPMRALEVEVSEMIRGGSQDLSEITAELTKDLEPNERFLVAGRIAEIIGRMPQPVSPKERPWVPAAEDLSVEQRHLLNRNRENENE